MLSFGDEEEEEDGGPTFVPKKEKYNAAAVEQLRELTEEKKNKAPATQSYSKEELAALKKKYEFTLSASDYADVMLAD